MIVRGQYGLLISNIFALKIKTAHEDIISLTKNRDNRTIVLNKRVA